MRGYKARWPIVSLAQRVTYIVDQDHKIRLAHHREFSMGSHIDAACQQIEHVASYHQNASFGQSGE